MTNVYQNDDADSVVEEAEEGKSLSLHKRKRVERKAESKAASKKPKNAGASVRVPAENIEDNVRVSLREKAIALIQAEEAKAAERKIKEQEAVAALNLKKRKEAETQKILRKTEATEAAKKALERALAMAFKHLDLKDAKAAASEKEEAEKEEEKKKQETKKEVSHNGDAKGDAKGEGQPIKGGGPRCNRPPPPHPCLPGAVYKYKHKPIRVTMTDKARGNSEYEFTSYWMATDTEYPKQKVSVRTGDSVTFSDGEVYAYLATLWADDSTSHRPRIVVLRDGDEGAAAVTMFTRARELPAPYPVRHPLAKQAEEISVELLLGEVALKRLTVKNTVTLPPRRETKPRKKKGCKREIIVDEDEPEPPKLPPSSTENNNVRWFYEMSTGVRSKRSVQKSTLFKKIKSKEVHRNTLVCPHPRKAGEAFKLCKDYFPDKFTGDIDMDYDDDDLSVPPELPEKMEMDPDLSAAKQTSHRPKLPKPPATCTTHEP